MQRHISGSFFLWYTWISDITAAKKPLNDSKPTPASVPVTSQSVTSQRASHPPASQSRASQSVTRQPVSHTAHQPAHQVSQSDRLSAADGITKNDTACNCSWRRIQAELGETVAGACVYETEKVEAEGISQLR